MTGLGDTMRGGNSRGHITLPAAGQDERSCSRECHQKKEGSWQPEEDPVGYFGNQDPERMFKLVPLVRGYQKKAEVWWWA